MSIRTLRLWSTALTCLVIAGLCTLAAGLDRVRQPSGGYPTTYIALVAAYVLALVALLYVGIAAPRLAQAGCRTSALIDRTGLWPVVGVALVTTALLIGQLESWLLPDSRLLGASAAIAAVVALGPLVVHCWRVDRPQDGIGARARDVSVRGIGAGIGALLVAIVATRTILTGHFAASTPLMCDEASTYWLFGRSLTTALTHFEFPNNHLLNSLVVFASTSALGPNTIAVRFAALIIGAAIVPTVFWMGRTLFTRRAAILGCALTASSPWLLFYSFQARGYCYATLFSIAAVAALWLTIEQSGSRWLWGVFVASMSLAFAALPTTLYLWCSLLLFGFGLYVVGHRGRAPERQWLWSFAISMAAIFAIAAFTYLNVFVFLWRTGSLSSGIFAFPELQPNSLAELVRAFVRTAIAGGFDETNAAPAFTTLAVVTVVAAFTGTVALIWERRFRILWLLGCLVAAPLPIVWLQPRMPYARNFIYLLPFVHAVAGYGLAVCIDAATRPGVASRSTASRAVYRYAPPGVAALLFAFALVASVRSLTDYLDRYHQQTWPAGQIAQYLERTAQPADGIVAGTCLDYMLASSLPQRFQVITTWQLWHSDPPANHRLYVVPASGSDGAPGAAARELLDRACSHRARAVVTHIGRQDVYRCEQL